MANDTLQTPRLVFHIGDPKTGTSTIQRVLHDQLITCDTQRVISWKTPNAISMARSLRPASKASRKQHFCDINKWLVGSSDDVGVISSEFFASVQPTVLKQALHRHVPTHRDSAEIIAYVRPHASRFLAAFVQRTKTGQLFDDIGDFFATIRENEPMTLRYSERFQNWKNVFEDRFALKPFIRSELINKDIAYDFFTEVLRGAPFRISNVVEENLSMTARSLSGLRRMQVKFKDCGIESKERGLLGGALANYFLASSKLSGEKLKLDTKMAEGLFLAYKEDARKLDANFFGRPIFMEALEKSLNDTVEEPVDLTADVYFSPSEVSSLDALGEGIARKFKECPHFWAVHHRNRMHNLILSPLQIRKITENISTIEAIDAEMIEAAKVLGA